MENMSDELKNKLSIVRRYIFELILVILCFATYKISLQYLEVDNVLRKYLFEDREKMIRLQENTNEILRNVQAKLN